MRDPRERGQGLIEFGLILVIAAVVAVVALVVFGEQLAAILDFIGAQADPAG
jgi:Flp pilus assembly pilin Flp